MFEEISNTVSSVEYPGRISILDFFIAEESKMELIKEGAEARTYRGSFFGIPAVFKIRVPKSYRHPEVDRRLVRMRLRNEARALVLARKAGVRVPRLLFTLPSQGLLVMEEARGERMSAVLSSLSEERMQEVLLDTGRQLALLHKAGLTHGDLTTSNIIIPTAGPVIFIDLSMSLREANLEDMGVDWRLLKEAFISTHYEIVDALGMIRKGYLTEFPEGTSVLERAEEIEGRGRYHVG
ncbi:MAG: KEOPS complex kinase/ATPase Bud32 [Thermoplasmata archaeon]